MRAGESDFDAISHLSPYLKARFDVTDKIGEGSYGQVYAATDRDNGSVCAVKHLKDVFADTYHAK